MTRTQLCYAQSHRDDRMAFFWGPDGELVELLEDKTAYMWPQRLSRVWLICARALNAQR